MMIYPKLPATSKSCKRNMVKSRSSDDTASALGPSGEEPAVVLANSSADLA
jgi:hypothetical protein